MSEIMARTNGERKFQGANALECESSRERKFPGHFAPGSESSRERKGQEAKVPRSELARVLLADSLRGANWPGSEKAVNHCSDVCRNGAYPVLPMSTITSPSLTCVRSRSPRSETSQLYKTTRAPRIWSGPSPWHLLLWRTFTMAALRYGRPLPIYTW